MSKLADELEHEVETTRTKLDQTLGNLQSRLHASGLTGSVDDLRETSIRLTESGQRLLDSVRANPVPALLVGAGLGFLVYDALTRVADRRRLYSTPGVAHPHDRDGELPENHPDRLHERLDDALEESFPGSDPVSVRITK
ncbi:hypothetical protein DK389_09455 [Methylobacterium durans]|uniref:DUF3618 domain-containing protein n=1 Tax=Methylobacterium durans TaxID=2202825 RepID=A0A2U8W5S5_9HYPH|nr:hypothetical protein DK389_09455 [Methylobacterium durans]